MTLFQSTADQRFRTVAPGVEFCYLRKHEQGGTTMLVRMAKGAIARRHDHPGGEETYLVSGRIRVADQVLQPGDYLWTPPGVAHDGYAEEASVFFVVLPQGLVVSDAETEAETG